MKQRTYLLLLILLGISHSSQACHSISDSLIGHWFVAEKNISYSSEESDNDNYHEEIIRHFIFNEDSTGYWLVETVKKHTDGKSDHHTEKFLYLWKIQDDTIILDFYEMNRTVECTFDISDSLLTLRDPENKTRKYSKKEMDE